VLTYHSFASDARPDLRVGGCKRRACRRQEHFHVKHGEDATRIDPESLNGTNDIEVRVFTNEARRPALLIAKFGYLGKGASGASVQNLMLMLGR
jgi:N-acetyl-gamma-glutamylphosphate reductase